MSRKKTTLEAVAKAAKVSKSTVSLVMLGKPGVGEDTRQRVLEIAQKMGYDQRRKARLEQAPLSQNEAVFMVREKNFISGSLFYNRYYQGIKDVLEPEGIQPNLASISDDQLERLELPAVMKKPRISGIIVGGELPRTYLDMLGGLGLPMILIGFDQPDLPWCRILNDNLEGSKAATQHLIGLGHKRIVCLSNRVSHPNIIQRIEGYTLAMLKEFGKLDPALTVSEEGPTSIEQGYETTVKLIKSGLAFTAIFATTDATAIGALKALEEAGLNVPGKISLVGFDNIDWGQHTHPPLTTINVDRRRLGNLAAEALIYQLRSNKDHQPLAQARFIIPVDLLARASTGPAPKK